MVEELTPEEEFKKNAETFGCDIGTFVITSE